MSHRILQARWILPMDSPPIEGGYVEIANGMILSVGSSRPAGAVVEDLGEVALAPGFVNAHSHLEFCDLLQPLGESGMRLPDWIRLVIAKRKRTTLDGSQVVAAGIAESLRCGVTTIGDIATRPVSEYVSALDASEYGASLPIALFWETIGFSASRIDSVYRDLSDRLRQCEGFQQSSRRIGLSPHAPYTVHPRLIERIVKAAFERNSVIAIHLAESLDELQLLSSGKGEFRLLLEERGMWDDEAIDRGTRPMDYLRMLTSAPRAAIVHGNYLRADEIQFTANQRDRMSIVYCPRTHRYFRHASYPLQQMLSVGARVAIGTDSLASNPDLNMLAELREAAWQHPNVSPEHLLRMGTLDAAFAIGFEEHAGSLTPGKWANMVALPLRAGVVDVFEAALFGAARPQRVWLRGIPVV